MPEEVVSGAPTATPPAAPATPVAPSPTPTPSPTPAPAQAPSGDDSDRRFKGIQADLAKERRARQQYEAQVNDYKQKLEAETRRVQALAGVAPVSADEAEAEEIRNRFSKVITPDYLLKQLGLSKEEIEEFKAAKADRESLQQTTNHYWAKHGQAMVGKVTKEISKELGGDLSKRQTEAITKAYILRAQSDPEFLQRHEEGDEALVTEFAKEWVEDWVEPARRKALQSEVQSFRRVPNGQNRGIVNNGEKKIDVNDPKAVEDLLVAGFKERNPGGFGRR